MRKEDQKFTSKNMHISKKISLAFISMVVGFGIRAAFAGPGHDDEGLLNENTAGNAVISTRAIETITTDGLAVLGATNTSWAGEILSTSDVNVYPSREGQITEWYVRLGQRVSQGQVLGRLAAPPASIELSMALAESAKALVLARAQSQATEQLVITSREQLQTIKNALDRSRDANVVVSETEKQQAQQSADGAKSELEALEILLPTKRQTYRSAIERLAYRVPSEIVSGNVIPSTLTIDDGLRLQLKPGFGGTDTNIREQFGWSLVRLVQALRDPSALPHNEVIALSQAVQVVLSTSTPLQDFLSASELSELKGTFVEDQTAVADAANALAEVEKDIIVAKTTLANALLTVGNAGNFKEKNLAEANKEFVEQQNELDSKLAELERELVLAHAEAKAAEVAYQTIANGAAGQSIVAVRSGVISAILKNTGDHVRPEDVVAGITGNVKSSRFVRLRIPSDQILPVVGDIMNVERPGFPFGSQKIKIVGVGNSLDAHNAYAADADFIETSDWPVHSSVRVVVDTKTQSGITVPFSAIWYGDGGATSVWIVMENNIIRSQVVSLGRATGDRVVVEDGLNIGDTYVLRADPDLKTGQSIVQTGITTDDKDKESPASGDGHGHSHEE